MTPPHGMHVQFIDRARKGRPDLRARQAVGYGHMPVLKLGHPGFDRGQFTLRLGAGALVDGDDLQAYLVHLAARARDGGVDLAPLALQPGEIAICRIERPALEQLLLHERLELPALFLHQPDLVGL